MSIGRLLQLALPLSIGLTVFAFALVVQREDGWRLWRHPGQLARSMLAMHVLMPAVAIALAWFFDLEPAVEVALIALAASPVSPLVPSSEVKAGGHASYAVALLFASALLVIVSVPVTMWVAGRIFRVDVHIPMRPVLTMALVTILVPVVIAVVAHGLIGHHTAQRVSRIVVKIAGVLIILAFLPIVLGSFGDVITVLGNGTLIAITFQVVWGLLAGHALGGPAHNEHTVLAMSTACRHPAVAMAIGAAVAPGQPQVPAAVLIYLVVSSLAAKLYGKWDDRRHPSPTRAVPA
jgi:BASS family bile acid:Na+ symporter